MRVEAERLDHGTLHRAVRVVGREVGGAEARHEHVGAEGGGTRVRAGRIDVHREAEAALAPADLDHPRGQVRARVAVRPLPGDRGVRRRDCGHLARAAPGRCSGRRRAARHGAEAVPTLTPGGRGVRARSLSARRTGSGRSGRRPSASRRRRSGSGHRLQPSSSRRAAGHRSERRPGQREGRNCSHGEDACPNGG